MGYMLGRERRPGGSSGMRTGRRSIPASRRWMDGSTKGWPASGPIRPPRVQEDPHPAGFRRRFDLGQGHYDSPYGRIESRWKRDGGKVVLDITIPPNSRAKIVLPGKTEEVGSGIHRFSVALP